MLHEKNPSTSNKIMNNSEKKIQTIMGRNFMRLQASQCSKSNAECVIEFLGTDNLVCFANGQILPL